MAALPRHHANRSSTLFCNPSLSLGGTVSRSGGRSGSRTPSLFSPRSRKPSRVRTDPTNGEPPSDPCVDQGDDEYQTSQQTENGWSWNFNLQLPYIPLAWAREHTDTSNIRSVHVVAPSFRSDDDADSIKATWLGHAVRNIPMILVDPGLDPDIRGRIGDLGHPSSQSGANDAVR